MEFLQISCLWLVLNIGLNGQRRPGVMMWCTDFIRSLAFLVTRWERRELTVVFHSLEAVLGDSLRLTVGVSCLISLCIFYSHSVVQQTNTFFNRRRREKWSPCVASLHLSALRWVSAEGTTSCALVLSSFQEQESGVCCVKAHFSIRWPPFLLDGLRAVHSAHMCVIMRSGDRGRAGAAIKNLFSDNHDSFLQRLKR